MQFTIILLLQSDSRKKTDRQFGKVVDIDNNIYNTVIIGNRVWTTQNLTVTHFRNGDTIFEAKTSEEFDKYSKELIPAWSYAVYNQNSINGTENVKIYGKLYNWSAVKDKRGMTPQGWYIATKNEWEELKNNCIENDQAVEDIIFELDSLDKDSFGFRYAFKGTKLINGKTKCSLNPQTMELHNLSKTIMKTINYFEGINEQVVILLDEKQSNN